MAPPHTRPRHVPPAAPAVPGGAPTYPVAMEEHEQEQTRGTMRDDATRDRTAGQDGSAGHAHEHAHEHHHAPRDVATEYVDAIADFRHRRDRAFAEGDDSPLPEQDRASFHGLRYFPADLHYRIEGLQPEPYGGSEAPTFAMQTSDGQLRQARRIATLRFELQGRPLALHAYGFEDSGEGEFFVPFLDATSGHETYGAGRYLDLEAEEDGSIVLDFNLAYHPLCVYSPFYSCPLPPSENRLPVRIEAGEMMPEGIGGHQ